MIHTVHIKVGYIHVEDIPKVMIHIEVIISLELVKRMKWIICSIVPTISVSGIFGTVFVSGDQVDSVILHPTMTVIQHYPTGTEVCLI